MNIKNQLLIALIMTGTMSTVCFSKQVSDVANIPVLYPNPDVLMKKSDKTIALEIGDNVPDGFEFATFPKRKKMVATYVTGWKKSLRNGFNNAFKEFYKVVDDPKYADLKLRIVRANCDLTPAAILDEAEQIGMVAILVHYHVKLIDSNGKVIAQQSFSAPSKMAPKIKKTELYSKMAQTAIESMYEKIVEEMFSE